MIITEIERAQLTAVRDDILIAINSVPFGVNFAQIAANNLFALIDQSEIAPMNGVPIAPLQAIVDALTALIKGDVPQIPPPDTGTVILEGSGGSITLADHTWTFGAHVDERGAKILRDGVQYASGVAVKLVSSAGIMWAQAGGVGSWWKDNGSTWGAGGAGPALPDPVLLPPAGGAASPEGTTITWPATGQSIVDSAGHVWTFGTTLQLATAHNPGPDYAVLKDGNPPSYGGAGKSMTIKGDVIQLITDNRWGRLVYKDTGTGWTLIEGTQ